MASAFGGRLKSAMAAAGMSRRAFAAQVSATGATGSGYTTIFRYLSGEVPPPLDFVAAAATLVGVSFLWLATGEGPWREARSANALLAPDDLEAPAGAGRQSPFWRDFPDLIAMELLGMEMYTFMSRPATGALHRAGQTVRASVLQRARPCTVRGMLRAADRFGDAFETQVRALQTALYGMARDAPPLSYREYGRFIASYMLMVELAFDSFPGDSIDDEQRRQAQIRREATQAYRRRKVKNWSHGTRRRAALRRLRPPQSVWMTWYLNRVRKYAAIEVSEESDAETTG